LFILFTFAFIYFFETKRTMNWMIFALCVYFFMMLLIGWVASKRMNNLSDYVLGGRGLGAAVTALSAGASDMSGWLLLGLPGSIYVAGLSEAWIVVGLLIGAFLNWQYMAPRLRVFTETFSNALTIPDYLEHRFKDTSRALRIVSAIVIVIFFTIYTSSGMVSGGRLFEIMFEIPAQYEIFGTLMDLPNGYQMGILLTSIVVITYTLFGGFLAVSWTDFVQGLIMVTALIVVPITVILEVGGIAPTIDAIRSVNPDLLSLTKTDWSAIGIISLMAWGLGYFGQPHIIVRFMAISSVTEIKKARNIGMWWMFFSITGAMIIGLVGIAYFQIYPAHTPKNPETVFIVLGKILFHPFVTGFLMAAILSAVMSTISSQLLVTSSALTSDFYKAFLHKNAGEKEMLFVSRAAVILISAIALTLSINPSDKILQIVAYAWAGLGAAFGPVILISLFWKKMTKWGALTGLITGAATVLIWKEFKIYPEIYEIIPGFFLNVLVVFMVSKITTLTDLAVEKEFEKAQELMEKYE